MPSLNIKIYPNRAHPSHKVVWEVVLYRTPRWLECYSNRFKSKSAALTYARLNLSNPEWSEVVIHPVLKEFCPSY